MLIAIAIPTFSSQLENAREATDAANIRSAYAELVSRWRLDGNTDSATDADATIKLEENTDAGTVAATIKMQQQTAGWQNSDLVSGLTDAGTTLAADANPDSEPRAGATATVTMASDGTATPDLDYSRASSEMLLKIPQRKGPGGCRAPFLVRSGMG